ncbi:C45 family autoproteolytic acyltransferase/hydolase [Metabacillus iocasae]|uniref:Choloylglycine hydrolase n=1 Tax=Priestia iocasae TaxID=2291674 RepID=A0ABS2QWS9_9BACI|nr:putative choloylglycine hydrolase [Metabacillus iocasae]
MQQIEVQVIQGTGTYRELGNKQGRVHRDSKLADNHKVRRKRSMRNYKVNVQKAKEYYERFAPHLWEELEGLAEGLDWSMEDVAHEYSGYQQHWKKSGCSALMQHGYYARNYDYHPKTYEGRFLIWKPTSAYASIGFATRMIGRIDGMNEKGLVVGYHFVNRRREVDGFICCTIARFLLDTCATTDEAITLLEKIPHRHAFNYSIYDSNGHAAIVEASGRGIFVKRGEGMSCTNHFDGLRDENRHHLLESKERLAHLEEHATDTLTALDAFTLFNSSERPIFKSDYHNSAGTIHTAVYIPNELKVIVGIGGNAKPLIFSFGDWLKGMPVHITKIKGNIETTEVFPFK